jgi:hypothetical protein
MQLGSETRAVWRKSSRSAADGDCVEIVVGRDVVAVRDSKDPDGVVLRFSGEEWRAFIRGVQRGVFDRC